MRRVNLTKERRHGPHARRGLHRVAPGASGAKVTAWAKRVDGKLARSLARRDLSAAGTAVAEYFVPGPYQALLRRVVGRLVGRSMAQMFAAPAEDLLTEPVCAIP